MVLKLIILIKKTIHLTLLLVVWILCCSQWWIQDLNIREANAAIDMLWHTENTDHFQPLIYQAIEKYSITYHHQFRTVYSQIKFVLPCAIALIAKEANIYPSHGNKSKQTYQSINSEIIQSSYVQYNIEVNTVSYKNYQ